MPYIEFFSIFRLHYEALKQAAFDPRDGTINMDILGTGVSNTARKQQKECADAIKKFVETNKGKQATFKYNVLMEEFRRQSDVVSHWLGIWALLLSVHYTPMETCNNCGYGLYYFLYTTPLWKFLVIIIAFSWLDLGLLTSHVLNPNC